MADLEETTEEKLPDLPESGEVREEGKQNVALVAIVGVGCLTAICCACAAAFIVAGAFGAAPFYLASAGQEADATAEAAHETFATEISPDEILTEAPPAIEETEEPLPSDTPEASGPVPDVSGTWDGSWQNTTFETSGDIAATIILDSDGSGSAEVDVGGFVFGAMDPPPVTFDAAWDAGGITFTLDDSLLFGNLTAIIFIDGTLEAFATVVPQEQIAAYVVTGDVTEDEMALEYFVTFLGGTIAEGVVLLVRAQ